MQQSIYPFTTAKMLLRYSFNSFRTGCHGNIGKQSIKFVCVNVREIDFLTKPHSLRHGAIEITSPQLCCVASFLHDNTHSTHTWITDSRNPRSRRLPTGGNNIDGVEVFFFLTCRAACNGATGGLSPACRSALCHSPDRPISAKKKTQKSGINLQHFKAQKTTTLSTRRPKRRRRRGQLRNPFSAVSQPAARLRKHFRWPPSSSPSPSDKEKQKEKKKSQHF